MKITIFFVIFVLPFLLYLLKNGFKKENFLVYLGLRVQNKTDDFINSFHLLIFLIFLFFGFQEFFNQPSPFKAFQCSFGLVLFYLLSKKFRPSSLRDSFPSIFNILFVTSFYTFSLATLSEKILGFILCLIIVFNRPFKIVKLEAFIISILESIALVYLFLGLLGGVPFFQDSFNYYFIFLTIITALVFTQLSLNADYYNKCKYIKVPYALALLLYLSYQHISFAYKNL